MAVFEHYTYSQIVWYDGTVKWVDDPITSTCKTIEEYSSRLKSLDNRDEMILMSHNFYTYIISRLDLIRQWPSFITACCNCITDALSNQVSNEDRIKFEEYLRVLSMHINRAVAAPAA